MEIRFYYICKWCSWWHGTNTDSSTPSNWWGILGKQVQYLGDTRRQLPDVFIESCNQPMYQEGGITTCIFSVWKSTCNFFSNSTPARSVPLLLYIHRPNCSKKVYQLDYKIVLLCILDSNFHYPDISRNPLNCRCNATICSTTILFQNLAARHALAQKCGVGVVESMASWDMVILWTDLTLVLSHLFWIFK